MKVSFLCVNFNYAVLTVLYIQNIVTLFAQDMINQIVVVDNASEQNDFEQLCAMLQGFERVKIIRSNKNLGYFGGLNFGLDNMDLKDCDMVIAGNNDIYFERDFLCILNKRYQDYPKETMVIAPDILNLDGVHQNPQYISDMPKIKVFMMDIYYKSYILARLMDFLMIPMRRRKREEKQSRELAPQPVSCIMGACILFTKVFFEQCGRLDNKVFLWGEEVILKNQVLSNHGIQYYDPALKVHHMESATTGKLTNKRKYDIVKQSYAAYRKYL